MGTLCDNELQENKPAAKTVDKRKQQVFQFIEGQLLEISVEGGRSSVEISNKYECNGIDSGSQLTKVGTDKLFVTGGRKQKR